MSAAGLEGAIATKGHSVRPISILCIFSSGIFIDVSNSNILKSILVSKYVYTSTLLATGKMPEIYEKIVPEQTWTVKYDNNNHFIVHTIWLRFTFCKFQMHNCMCLCVGIRAPHNVTILLWDNKSGRSTMSRITYIKKDAANICMQSECRTAWNNMRIWTENSVVPAKLSFWDCIISGRIFQVFLFAPIHLIGMFLSVVLF